MTMLDATERAEWLARRRSGIGGSDVAGILGLSPWTSPWSIWADKCGLISLDDPGNPAMEFGTRAEPMLCGYLADRTGLHVFDQQTELTRDGWAKCTLDGRLIALDKLADPEARDAADVAELKTTSEPEWDHIPVHYQCQGQWSMHVTGARRVVFGVLHFPFGRPSFRTYTLDRDDAEIDLIVDRCRGFWFRHVLAEIPPDVDASDATTTALAHTYPAPDPTVLVQADDATRHAWSELVHLRSMAKDLGDRIALRENALRARIGDAGALVDGEHDNGAPVVLATWKPETRSTVDAAALRERLPRTAARFTNTTTTRVLRVKSPKG